MSARRGRLAPRLQLGGWQVDSRARRGELHPAGQATVDPGGLLGPIALMATPGSRVASRSHEPARGCRRDRHLLHEDGGSQP
jgi:hypothetical protein